MALKNTTPKTSRHEALDAPLFRGKKSLRQLAREKPESWWLAQGEKRALDLFHDAAARVPAYKDFLKKRGIDPRSVKTIAEYTKVPITTKKNYIQAYSLRDRCWDGNLSTNALIAASSGTTGEPTLWPRGRAQEAEALEVHEQLFVDLYDINRYRTLVIVCFPMGIYISGIATALPMFLASIRHKNLTLITPGNNKENVLKVLPGLQKEFEQIVFVGHPFFIKEVLEAGKKHRISWEKSKIKAFFCSEGFSEEWRKYIASYVKGSIPELDFFNTYGSSELLLMAYESPETIAVKEVCEKHQDISTDLFGTAEAPYLFQYNPYLRYIERSPEGELLFTANSGIPLLRFNLHDAGLVLTKNELVKTFERAGRIYPRNKKWHEWNYPFVVLFGRSDYTLIYYAANIYPGQVHKALSEAHYFGKITGKFTLEKTQGKSHAAKLHIYVELAQGVPVGSRFRNVLEKRVVATLLKTNMEFGDAVSKFGKKIYPKIILCSYRDPHRFPVGLKPRYIVPTKK